MSTQLLHSEAKPDKQALATVLQFLKNQNLSQTEEALRKELGFPSSKSVPGVLQSSQTQPEQVDEAYSKPLVTLHQHHQQRTQSLNIEPMMVVNENEEEEEEEETISVDDDESEDEGPHSWPGRKHANSSPVVPSESFLKSIGFQQQSSQQHGFPTVHPIAANRSTLQPLILNSTTATTALPTPCGLPVPTIFTIVPSGLVPTRQQPSINTSFIPRLSSPVIGSPEPKSDRPSVLSFLPSDKQNMPVYTEKHSVPVNNKIQQSCTTKCATTLAAIPPEEMTPAYLELKEFAEAFKNKRIQLGYTQGAVGQSLADRGYSNFAQSTISRFEQMQLSPSNAAAIKVVLERWLHEADNPEGVSTTVLDPLGPPRKRKKRAVFSTQTREILEEYFAKEARPNRQIIETIADELSLLPEEVRVWFCNKRQKYKIADDGSSMNDESKSSPSSPNSSRSVSPPRTKFTIEELSKSSSSTGHSFSPVAFTNAFSVSPQRPQPMLFSTGTGVKFSSQPFIMNSLVTKA